MKYIENVFISEIRFVQDIKQDKLVVRMAYANDKNNFDIRFCLDDIELVYSQTENDGLEVRRRYMTENAGVTKEYFYWIELPKEWTNYKQFRIVAGDKENSEVLEKLSRKELVTKRKEVLNVIETINWNETGCELQGWAVVPSADYIRVRNFGKEISYEVSTIERTDVDELFPEVDNVFAYKISFAGKYTPRCFVYFKNSEDKWIRYRILKSKENRNVVRKIGHYVLATLRMIKKKGIKHTAVTIKNVLRGNGTTSSTYDEFLKKYSVTKEELEKQKGEFFKNSPKISIVVPLYKTPEKYLRELIESVQKQTYSNWELCLADGSGDEEILGSILADYTKKDSRIVVKVLENNGGIAENTNQAMTMATGEYVALADHDDLLAPNALYECVKAINDNNEIDVLYSDEDKVDMSGKRFFEPNFKPDFNLDYLCSVNYICHLFVFKKSLFDKLGGFRKEFDGAQDHDLILRYTEAANVIHHIPMVLYHWRCHINSTAENPESKLYAFENGAKAVEEHYKRIGVPAHVKRAEQYGLYRTYYDWTEQPKISILVPNKDHIDDLKKCMDSIDNNSVYRNYEWIIIENNSTEQETWDYYEKIKTRENVNVVYYDGDFNYSKINNFGAKHASGEYLLLLNNDTEMIGTDSLKEMVDIAMRDDVGIVGAKLLYPDDTIQHAGVVVGFGGIAGHTFIGLPRTEPGYVFRAIATQDYSAVTAACLMVRKSIFDEVNGLTEEFKVAFNDIDFCLKVREKGKLVVYSPNVLFYHHESKSRGLEDTPEKIRRFQTEILLLQERWADILKNGDPYYNVNLSLDRSDFGVKS